MLNQKKKSNQSEKTYDGEKNNSQNRQMVHILKNNDKIFSEFNFELHSFSCQQIFYCTQDLVIRLGRGLLKKMTLFPYLI